MTAVPPHPLAAATPSHPILPTRRERQDPHAAVAPLMPPVPPLVPLPLVLLPAAIVGDETMMPDGGIAREGVQPISRRMQAIAGVFLRAGWDIGFYGPREGTARSESAVFQTDLPAYGRTVRYIVWDGGADWLERVCAAPAAFGRLPRTVVLAPMPIRSLEPTTPTTPTASTAPSAAGTQAYDQTYHRQLSAALELAHAQERAWREHRGEAAAVAASAAGEAALVRYAQEDVSVIALIDASAHARDLQPADLPFALTQVAMQAAVPVLARAFAPGIRMAAVCAPLCSSRVEALSDAAGGPAPASPSPSPSPSASAGVAAAAADEALGDALCFVAQARTLTGSTLRLNAVPPV